MRDCELEHPDITRALRTGYPWDDYYYEEPADRDDEDPTED